MRSKLLQEEPPRTWAVIFDKGDQAMEELADFAADHQLDASRLTGVGAFSRVTLGYFDRDRMDYDEIPVDEQVELLSLVGDIARGPDGDPAVHAHVVVGRRDGTTLGGHLLAATVWPTLELIVSEAPAHLCKSSDPETGLALIDPDR